MPTPAIATFYEPRTASLQYVAAGRLPPPETNGRRYLKLPLDALGTPPWD